jgi:hypothetical protein
MTDMNDIVRRYVALWNEADAERRRAMIAELFAPDAAQFTPTKQVHGHGEMEQRVILSHEKWVRDERRMFLPLGEPSGHNDIIRMRWQMVHQDGGPATSVGTDVLLLDAQGRIRTDWQFVDPM